MLSHALVTLTEPSSVASEAYRALRTNIEFVDEPIKTLLVTSAGPDEQKDVTLANMAITMADGGQAVITVTRIEDGDFAALSEVEIGGVREFLADRTERTDFEGFYQTLEEEASIQRPE